MHSWPTHCTKSPRKNMTRRPNSPAARLAPVATEAELVGQAKVLAAAAEATEQVGLDSKEEALVVAAAVAAGRTAVLLVDEAWG